MIITEYKELQIHPCLRGWGFLYKDLIKSIKKLINTKIIVVTDKNIKEADATLMDLKPDSIIKILKGINNE